jgi:RNA polymerase sigma-70 factor, ECF subfamily
MRVDQDEQVETDAHEAIAQVYREQGPRLWRALYAYSGSPEIASDALADALAQALAHRSGIEAPAPWVWTVAFRVAAGELKRRGRERPYLEGGYEAPEPVIDLMAALETLSPNQRAAVILHGYSGYSTKEIARMLGSSAATVRVHLSQGRRRLRAAMEVQDG